MSCYFVARIKISDEEEYGRYLEHADEVFSKFSGRYLAVDKSPETLEGETEQGRVVIIEFPDESELKRWYYSPEYQEILKHRLKAAECETAIVKGL
jgi:uncharacterized protein (DUF1330 family)